MAINSVGNSNFLLGQSIVGLKNQLETLQTQLATGKKSTVYSGMGVNEGFAIFARAQISNLSAFTTTMTNINTTVDTTSTALQSFGKIASQVKSAAASGGAIVTGSGQTVTGPSGSPAAVSVNLGASNPSNGDQVTFTFNLPDGTTEAIQLTASTATPPPSGSFAIGATSTATATNLKAALNTALGTLANTALVAASAMAASDNFFNTDGMAIGSVVNN